MTRDATRPRQFAFGPFRLTDSANPVSSTGTSVSPGPFAAEGARAAIASL